MTQRDIIDLVEKALDIKIDDRSLKPSRTARYCAMIIMVEEGYSHGQIAKCFNRDRSTITIQLTNADSWLKTDKEFKDGYWKCRILLNEKEEQDDAA